VPCSIPSNQGVRASPREGVTRDSGWVNGKFADDVIFGLLDAEFTA
jgi:hypothetical protein